jgi:hypothetical protein
MIRAMKAAPAIFVAAGLVYLALTVPHLDRYPPVGEDEPWIAAAPVKLATQGVLGNDLFAGYYSMERHHLQHMPVYPLLEAGVFRLLGVGVWQMRALSVAFGLVLLAVVFVVGAQTGDARVGLVAVLILLLLKTTTGESGSGILLLDRARVNRYDIAVPVFGLMALWSFNRAGASGGGLMFFTAGLFAGLSTLSHLYGIFWIVVLLAVAPRERRVRSALLIAAGFVLTCTPWVLFVVRYWADYVGQMKSAGARFELFDPAFYLRNALTADGPISAAWAIRSIRELPLLRVGSWTMLFGLALSAGIAAAAAWRRSLSLPEAALIGAAAIQLLLFTSLLTVKTMPYMIALWPIGSLVLAWGLVRVWSRSPAWIRAAIVVVLCAALAEGVGGIMAAQRSARRVSPYDFYTAQIARCIPPGARVLGFQHYWMGLRQFEYRTWLLPIGMSRPEWYGEDLTLHQALERVDPDVVLIDRFMANYLREVEAPGHPYHLDGADVKSFMDEHGAVLACSVTDRSYGAMLVYMVSK